MADRWSVVRSVARGDRGISMVEIIIASGIFMGLLAAVLSMLDSGTKAERTQQARSDAFVELRDAMSTVSDDLRQAVSIAPDSSRTRLTIETLRPGAEHWTVFEVAGGQLLMRTCETLPCGGIGRVLAADVSSVTPFCYDPPNCQATSASGSVSNVRIALAVQPQVAGGDMPLATDVELRNL